MEAARIGIVATKLAPMQNLYQETGCRGVAWLFRSEYKITVRGLGVA